jgi:membrane-associated phospholipid phosphatase
VGLFESLYAAMTKPWVVIAIIVILLLSFLYIDEPVAYYFQNKAFGTQYPWLFSFTLLGDFKLYLGAFFIMALYFRYVRRLRRFEICSWYLWFCVLVPSIVCTVLKIMLGRARPELLFSDQLYGFYGFHLQHSFWSFPSGHTTTIMGLMFGLCTIFPRYFWGFMLLGASSALTRCTLNYHYPSDVLSASYLSLVLVGFLYRGYYSKNGFR